MIFDYWFVLLTSSSLIQRRAVHLHLTQAQKLLPGDDHVDVATVHPVTLELTDTTRWDAGDHSAPGRRNRNDFRSKNVWFLLL